MNILRFVAILGLLALSCFAAPGDLDLSFGGTGKVLTDRTDPSGSSNYAFCMALQSDGKIVVAGENFDMVRYFSNGSLDAGFGNGGRISNGYNASAGLGIKVQADGKIVVAGYASGNFRVIRYNPTGTVDGSFNAASIDFGTTDDYATDLAIVSGGKIVVAGVTGTNAAANFALARLNANGSLDTTFGTAGKVTADFAGNDDEAGSMVVQPDGKIIVAGFAWVGSNRDFAAVRYNIDGSLDPSFGVGGKVTTPIGQSDDYGGAVALQSDGKIVLAGKATKVNSYADLAAVRYNPNGSLDNSFGTGGKVITTVSTFNDSGASDVLIQPDGKIVVVGPTGFGTNSDFTVVRYQMNGALDTGFGIGGKVLTGMGSDDPPQGAALQSDGKIVVAGYSYQSATSYDIAVVRYLGDGPAGGTLTVTPPSPVAVDTMLTATFAGWTSATLPLSYEVRSGTTVLVPAGSNATPSFVLAQGTYVLKGRVYDGAGNFTDTPPVTYQVANPEIVVEQPVGSNLVDGGANVSFGSVLVGASANLVFTIKNSGVSALLGLDVTVDGADAAMFTVTAPPAASVSGSAITTFTVRFAPTSVRQKTAALHIASNDADENPFDIVLTGSGAGPGVVDSFNPNIGGSTVYTAVMQPDGKMVIGGNFSSVGGLARGNIARFTANGAIEDNAGFGTGTGTNGDVFAITLQPDGKLVLGGGFTDVSGQSRQNVARVNANGAIDFGFSASLSSNAEVFGTAVQDGGSILLVGAFTNVNALLHNHIARVTTNGVPEIPATFETGAGANGIIYAVALQPDGKILIGGEFTTFNGQPRGYVARLEANGNAESAAAFSAATNGFVSAVAVQADGKIVIAGDFTTANGQPRGRIARLGADGALESTATFNPGAGADGPIYSLALQADGKLIVAGEFTSFSGEARGGVARLNTDGSLDGSAAFATGTGADGPVYGVTLQADGKVILCGTFTGVDGQARNHLARLSNDTAAQSLAATATTRVQWLRSGAAPEIEGVIFESSTNGWANWTTLGTGTRIAGGWERTGLNLSGIGQLRARGRVASGTFGGSQSIIEQVAAFDFLTQPPVLNLPATATVIAPPVNVSFSLPEAALPGSVQLTFDDGATPRVMTLAASRESAGAHAFAFDIANPTGSPEIASCPAIPEGTYSVTLRYQDAPGNASANSATATNVRVAATPLRAWKLAQLGDIEAPDLGDTDRDGLMHLIEYALMLSPTASSSPPKLTRFTYPEGQRLRMFFTRDPARSDVTIEIQSAPSIAGPWTTIAASTLGSVTTGPGYVGGDSAGAGVKTVEVRDTVNMSAANTRWMRVKVMR